MGILWAGCSQNRAGEYQGGGLQQEAWPPKEGNSVASPLLPGTKNLFQESEQTEGDIQRFLDILSKVEDVKSSPPQEKTPYKIPYPDIRPENSNSEMPTDGEDETEKNEEKNLNEENNLEDPFATLNPFAGKLDAGENNTCSINKEGILSCWGPYAELIRTEMPRPSSRRWKWVSVSPTGACAVDMEGFVECWGRWAKTFLNPPSYLKPARAVSVGKRHACIITLDGNHPQCWGDTSAGRLEGIPHKAELKQIAVGGLHTCGLTLQGKPVCWGDDSYQQLIPERITREVIQVCTGEDHSCYLTATGAFDCFGSNFVLKKDLLPPIGSVVDISCGRRNICLVDDSHSFYCLGPGLLPSILVHYPPTQHQTQYLVTGLRHVCMVTLEEEILCFSDNDTEQFLDAPQTLPSG